LLFVGSYAGFAVCGKSGRGRLRRLLAGYLAAIGTRGFPVQREAPLLPVVRPVRDSSSGGFSPS
jgi:hypothetical protein